MLDSGIIETVGPLGICEEVAKVEQIDRLVVLQGIARGAEEDIRKSNASHYAGEALGIAHGH